MRARLTERRGHRATAQGGTRQPWHCRAGCSRSGRGLPQYLRETALATAKVFLIIATAGLSTRLFTVNGFPALVGSLLLSITRSPVVIMGLIVLILLIIMIFKKSIAALTLLLPILYPVVVQVGIDPVYFGVMAVIGIEIELVTPPVGLCLAVAEKIAEVRIAEAMRALTPFIAAIVALLVILLSVPDQILVIPRALMGGG